MAVGKCDSKPAKEIHLIKKLMHFSFKANKKRLNLIFKQMNLPVASRGVSLKAKISFILSQQSAGN